MSDKNIKIDYSVIIPVFNEEETILELHKRLILVMNQISDDFEVIFVDDGSGDRTFEIIKTLHAADNRIKAIKFTRNFGHHVAITAGLDYAGGNSIMLMDGDLQDPPEEILKLDKKFKEGYEIVYAIRKTRKDTFIKRMSSGIFYKLFKLFGNVNIPSNTGIFRIISGKVADYMKGCREKNRFISGMLSWPGYSSIGVETDRDQRYAGKTKYNIYRSLKLASDAMMSFSSIPLHFVSYLGFAVAALSFATGVSMAIQIIIYRITLSGWALVAVPIFFFGGVQLVIMGVIGEYIGRIYAEVQNRPLYVVNEKLGIEQEHSF